MTTENKENDSVDKQLYDRQLYVLDMESMKKMTSSHVLLCGLNGLGVEIAKNIILTGVKSVTLYDPKPVEWADLSSQFFFTENSVGKNRASECISKLEELNKYVIIKQHTGELTEDFIKQFNVVVFADHHTPQLIEYNKICRQNDIKFISTESRGLFGSIFCDFGDQFLVTDTNGEPPITRIVVDISQGEDDKEATVSVTDEERHDLSDGDKVTFSGIEGMEELNNTEPIEVKITGPFTFKLVGTDISKYKPYIRNGYVHQVKRKEILKFKDLESSLKEPDFLFTDFAKMERPPIIHNAFRAVSNFAQENDREPKPYNEEDAKSVLSKAKEFDSEIDEDIVKKFSYTCSGNINPMATFLGGMVAQEVQKACSSKFTPIKQWLFIDGLECLPKDLPSEEDTQPKNSRYDGQIAVFGNKFQERIQKSQVFVVGAGALGCEFLKNYAMQGIGTSGNGKLIVTDMDNIEVSNLSRQFLFRQQHVGQPKSQVAAATAQEMNKNMNIDVYQDKVAPETEETFHDSFWDNLDVVTNALDNIDARLYVDGRCVYYQKPLLESGTLGTKGNVQVCVPFVTESYGSSRDPPEKTFPTCTIKNFPSMVEHTIAWAKDLFGGLFSTAPSDANAFLERSDFLDSLKPGTKLQTVKTIHDCLVSRPSNFEECLVWARIKFEELFNHNIKQLLHNFPLDSKTSSGAPFWAPPKRPPTPLEFDSNDPLHVDFITTAANLRAYNFGIKDTSADPKTIKPVVDKVIPPQFEAKNVKIKVDDKDEDNDEDDQVEADNKQMDSYISELENIKPKAHKLEEIEFEKDDDTNFHIDFITAASNLRARSYKIPEADRHKTKGIAGKIIPAMITTTALVTGLVGFEFYKLIQDKDDIEQYKNAFANVALPMVTMSEPMPAPKQKYGDKEFTLWDKFDLDFGEDITLGELIDFFEQEHKLEISMISSGAASIYAFFLAPDKAKYRLAKPVSEIVAEVSKREYHSKQQFIDLEILCSDESGEDVDVPPIRYRFRNFSGEPKNKKPSKK
eukprot:gb/GECH01007427.1/.p1 GENE.gb/GECH01007427.1/~~gb/GECH01007427.1/.p1  ORF type:complete len:1022 (+),score=286.96 gb/GECH01007427.1/:1-3066(+)